MIQALKPDKAAFIQLATMRMPFGKYRGLLLVDLPEPYLVWFSQKGFPEGTLGEHLKAMYEIKRNGLEYLFKPKGTPTEAPRRKLSDECRRILHGPDRHIPGKPSRKTEPTGKKSRA